MTEGDRRLERLKDKYAGRWSRAEFRIALRDLIETLRGEERSAGRRRDDADREYEEAQLSARKAEAALRDLGT